MRIVSGHQPAYLPWLGLIHKACLCDVFIYMDDVQYLERDWNNRNRIKVGENASSWLTVPVNLKDSKSKILKDIQIKGEENIKPSERWNNKHWGAIQNSYRRSKFFNKYSDFFEDLYLNKSWVMLTDLNLYILREIFLIFEIEANIIIASECNFTKKKTELLVEHAIFSKSKILVTGINGPSYIDFNILEENEIQLYSQNYNHPVYTQRFGDFLPNLSYIDLLFNHGPNSKKILLSENITKGDLLK